jgi:biotin carboxylase
MSNLTREQIENRIILLMGSRSYRANPFVQAAERLGLQIVRGIDLPKELADYYKPILPLQFADPDRAAQDLVAYAKAQPVHTILAVDDDATVIAARACAELDMTHNSPDAAFAAKHKQVMRERLQFANVPSPRFQLFSVESNPELLAAKVGYPCVVKPTMLSASQGVIRADDPSEFVAAFNRTCNIIRATGAEPNILVEDYIPGFEVAVEGILSGGRLKLLALFDKPDPLTGPYFEETIYVTP